MTIEKDERLKGNRIVAQAEFQEAANGHMELSHLVKDPRVGALLYSNLNNPDQFDNWSLPFWMVKPAVKTAVNGNGVVNYEQLPTNSGKAAYYDFRHYGILPPKGGLDFIDLWDAFKDGVDPVKPLPVKFACLLGCITPLVLEDGEPLVLNGLRYYPFNVPRRSDVVTHVNGSKRVPFIADVLPLLSESYQLELAHELTERYKTLNVLLEDELRISDQERKSVYRWALAVQQAGIRLSYIRTIASNFNYMRTSQEWSDSIPSISFLWSIYEPNKRIFHPESEEILRAFLKELAPMFENSDEDSLSLFDFFMNYSSSQQPQKPGRIAVLAEYLKIVGSELQFPDAYGFHLFRKLLRPDGPHTQLVVEADLEMYFTHVRPRDGKAEG